MLKVLCSDCSGPLLLLLPEVKGHGLPETVEDLEMMWNKTKSKENSVAAVAMELEPSVDDVSIDVKSERSSEMESETNMT